MQLFGSNLSIQPCQEACYRHTIADVGVTHTCNFGRIFTGLWNQYRVVAGDQFGAGTLQCQLAPCIGSFRICQHFTIGLLRKYAGNFTLVLYGYTFAHVGGEFRWNFSGVGKENQVPVCIQQRITEHQGQGRDIPAADVE
jgi:hypothetical protein